MKTYFAYNEDFFVLDPEAPIIAGEDIRKISIDEVSGLVTLQFFGEQIDLTEEAWGDVADRFQTGLELRADFYAEQSRTLETADGDVTVPVAYVDQVIEAFRDDTDPKAVPVPDGMTEADAEAAIEEIEQAIDWDELKRQEREAQFDAELAAEAREEDMADDGEEAFQADRDLNDPDAEDAEDDTEE